MVNLAARYPPLFLKKGLIMAGINSRLRTHFVFNTQASDMEICSAAQPLHQETSTRLAKRELEGNDQLEISLPALARLVREAHSASAWLGYLSPSEIKRLRKLHHYPTVALSVDGSTWFVRLPSGELHFSRISKTHHSEEVFLNQVIYRPAPQDDQP